MKAMSPVSMLFAIALLALLVVPAVGQDHGSGHSGGGGGGGGGGCGDVFGDLIHILRYVDEGGTATGQPVLAQRWVELPREEPGYGWGYCPVAVYSDADGDLQEIPFVPYTCDLDPDYLELVEEVDYFGRLNGGRTKERNHRMHLDEVIANIKAGDLVKRDPAGRLMIGFDCAAVGQEPCGEWATVDSPMASMALYTRLMKYGHLATDPYEIDTWAMGDPKLPTQFHPALAEQDWPKFHSSLEHLLPGDGADPGGCWDYSDFESFTDLDGDGLWDAAEPFIDIDKDGEFDCCYPRPEPFTDLDGDGQWDAAEPFDDSNENGVPDEFSFLCAGPEELGNKDFMSAASFLAAAANKTGKVTDHLVQYLNRILKITIDTPHTVATLATLPALYRDCWDSSDDPVDPPEEGDPVEGVEDPPYLPAEDCVIVAADPIATPNYELFTDVQELFVDYSDLDDYEREADGEQVEIIVGTSKTTWSLFSSPLVDWIAFVNGTDVATENIRGFVDAASDALRSIEYIHNYAVPEDLYCKYDPAECL